MSACKAATVSKRAVRALLRGCDGARVCAHLHPRRIREGLAHAHAAGVIVLKMDRAHRGARVTSSRSCRWRMRDARLTHIFITVPEPPFPERIIFRSRCAPFFCDGRSRRGSSSRHTTGEPARRAAYTFVGGRISAPGIRAAGRMPRPARARSAHPKEPTIGVDVQSYTALSDNECDETGVKSWHDGQIMKIYHGLMTFIRSP